MVFATSGRLRPTLFVLIALHTHVEPLELAFLVRHRSDWRLSFEEATELQPNVARSGAIAILRETTLFVLANAYPKWYDVPC